MHLVMFDIDGTLYADAVREVTGVVLDQRWGRYEHVSDSGILEQVLRDSWFDRDRDALAARVQELFVGRVREHLERAAETVREIAGAKRLIERLRALPNVRIAIATGGWEPTALLKLAHVGIDVGALGFASSSDARARTDIMRLAAERALRGAALTRGTYFGDGPWDRAASAEFGYDFVAVGRGVSNAVAYDDFGDTAEILAQLGVLPDAGKRGNPS
ncbi:MAG TPA: HAD family hydrolase [Gammaproteobacteria bacterium]